MIQCTNCGKKFDGPSIVCTCDVMAWEQSPKTGQVDAIVIGTEAHKKQLEEAFKAGEWMEYFDEEEAVLLEMYGYTNFDEWYSNKYQ